MKIHYSYVSTFLIWLIILLFSNKSIANVNDSLHFPTLEMVTTQNNIENSITENCLTIKNIIPQLAAELGHIVEIKYILENYHKVEKLWGYYEEAKRDGTNLNNNPLIKELAFSAKYTLYLLNESLDKILINLNNERLRVALVKWKSKKLEDSKQIYQQDEKDLDRLEKMKPSIIENPTITNTKKLASLLQQRDILYRNNTKGKKLGEFRKNQSKKIEEVELFYTCDTKKRLSQNVPQNIMDFASDKAIKVIQLDREIYQFRLIALASLPYKEQQYFKLKKALVLAANKAQNNTNRKFLKKKIDPVSHHSLILKDYNKLVNSLSFEEQNRLRTKEKIFNHKVISVIEFWGCPDFFPAFYSK